MSDLFTKEIIQRAESVFELIKIMPDESKVELINTLKIMLHKISPMKLEPVDCVQWIKADLITANDYNPNIVAPPEMELLKVSILEDGYTQPIVTFVEDGKTEVVDGFHRNKIGKECKIINDRIQGYLPIVIINQDRVERGDRIASTIRHNRARGKHRIDGMSNIIVELKRRNWSDEKIGRELGMDADEILRLAQITGLAEMFKDKEFSMAWEVDNNIINEDDNLENGLT